MTERPSVDALLAALPAPDAPASAPELPDDGGEFVLLAHHRTPPPDLDRTRAALDARVGADAAALLLPRMIPVQLAAGRRLFVHGEDADALYLLCEGALDVHLDLGGRQLVLGRVPAGRWLGEVNLLDGGPASATVTATGDCRLMRLTREDLRELRTAHPAAALALTRSLNQDLARRVRRNSAGVVSRMQDGRYALASAAEAEQLLAALVIADLAA